MMVDETEAKRCNDQGRECESDRQGLEKTLTENESIPLLQEKRNGHVNVSPSLPPVSMERTSEVLLAPKKHHLLCTLADGACDSRANGMNEPPSLETNSE